MTADFTRQLDILPPSAIVYPVTMIGLGGIGSHAIYTIRKLGFTQLTMWDPDEVQAHNIPSQFFSADDKGSLKTEAVRDRLYGALETPCDIDMHSESFTEGHLEGIVVSGVDSMESRMKIWKSVLASRAFVPLYIDGRVGVEWDDDIGKVIGEWIEVFTVSPSQIDDCELYKTHLFADDDAEPLRCTAQAVAYIGPLIAGFIGAQIRKWVGKESYHRHFMYDC